MPTMAHTGQTIPGLRALFNSAHTALSCKPRLARAGKSSYLEPYLCRTFFARLVGCMSSNDHRRSTGILFSLAILQLAKADPSPDPMGSTCDLSARSLIQRNVEFKGVPSFATWRIFTACLDVSPFYISAFLQILEHQVVLAHSTFMLLPKISKHDKRSMMKYYKYLLINPSS